RAGGHEQVAKPAAVGAAVERAGHAGQRRPALVHQVAMEVLHAPSSYPALWCVPGPTGRPARPAGRSGAEGETPSTPPAPARTASGRAQSSGYPLGPLRDRGVVFPSQALGRWGRLLGNRNRREKLDRELRFSEDAEARGSVGRGATERGRDVRALTA